MARLPYVERDQAPPIVQQAYDRLRAASGRVLNIFRLMAHRPESLSSFLDWYPTLREGPLDIGLRQLAYVRASQLNRCGYCVTHNRASGQRAGVPAEKFEALERAATSPLFSDVERRVIRYAEEMTVNVQVDAALVEALRGDLGDPALVQLTMSIAAANFTNRFNEALRTDLEARSAGTPAAS